MINFRLYDFWLGQLAIAAEQHNAALRIREGDAPIDEETHIRIQRVVGNAIKNCVEQLSLMDANISSLQLNDMLNLYPRVTYTNIDLLMRLQTLQEHINIAIRQEYFFHYPRELSGLSPGLTTVKIGGNINDHWQSITTAFPASKREIEAGLDCYAFGDSAGCVFHMMRLAELGLREIAGQLGVATVKRGKPLEYAMWGEVIEALQSAIDDLVNAKGNAAPLTADQRATREDKKEYYRTIMADVQALLSLRDKNAHFRDDYDKDVAYSAMYRTNEMMALLAKGSP